MKHKLFELFKKYKLALIIGLVMIIIGIIIILLYVSPGNKLLIKEYTNLNYNVKYDNSWKINYNDDKSIVLEHNKGSNLKIEIIDLKDEYKFSNINDLADDLLFNIETKNKDFKLIYKNNDTVTKNKYDGYKMLFENNDSQAMVVVAKKSENLIIFTFEAKNNYFDMTLDSVQNIIYNFDTLEKKINLTNELNIKTKKITFTDSKTVESLLNETIQQEIANNNYYVKYNIPSNFKISSLNSQIGMFKFNDLTDGKISIVVNLFNLNIYEYLDQENVLNVYNEYKQYKTNKNYSKFTESIAKFENNYESYIYKCSYYYDKALEYNKNNQTIYTSELKDNVILIYALDKNHTLLIKISSSKVAIPKKLIDMIKIISSENYASYISSTNENGMLKNSLKRFVGTNNMLEEIIINLPEKYKEIDKNLNIYTNQNYSLDYNKDFNIYNYDVEYYLSSEYQNEINEQIKIVNSSIPKSYGNYKELTYSGKKNVNNKNFIIYDGEYTDIYGIMFTDENRTKYNVKVKMLFYKLENGGYLIIKLKGKGKQINNEILNEITNFEIKN